MDAFWTDEEMLFRDKARDFFCGRERCRPPLDLAIPSELGLSGRIAVVEEAAFHDPKLGRELASSGEGSASADRIVDGILHLAFLAGTASCVLDAGSQAARERGDFSSSLMGCREVQESLAGLASGAELLRLGTCRLCRLLERGERDRADAEAARLLAGAGVIARNIKAVALSLLGEPWIAENLPGEY